jgi:hypothetical protein
LNVLPYSCHSGYLAGPALSQVVLPPFLTGSHLPAFWYSTKNRIQMLPARCRPGAWPRIPIESGWFLVSQMLTVAQRFFTADAWTWGAVSAPASGPLAATAATATSEPRRMREREGRIRGKSSVTHHSCDPPKIPV